MNKTNTKTVEIFCGTGGVGKTTLSCARAIYLSEKQKKVIIITLDPSQRLKDFLDIKESQIGLVKQINPYLHAQVIRPENLLLNSNLELQSENRILNSLLGPYGGMNEIYGLLEVHKHYVSKQYDCIILDTAPGRHFIDFVESAQKIRLFFENSFLIFFHQLKSQIHLLKKTPLQVVISKIMESGVKKLMLQLEKVTGINFVQDFIDTIDILYVNREKFLRALELQPLLSNSSFSNWFLVSAADYDVQDSKINLENFHHKAKKFFHEDSYFILNRTQAKMWKDIPTLTGIWQDIRNKLLEQEHLNGEDARKSFKNVLTFSLLDNLHIDAQLRSLVSEWESF